MIKIPFEELELKKMANKFYNEVYTRLALQDKINNTQWPNELRNVIAFININLKEIITGTPEQLEQIILALEQLIRDAKQEYVQNNGIPLPATRRLNKWFKEQMEIIFNYNNGSQSFTNLLDENGDKIAYLHSESLGLNTCVYCNANFTYTIKTKEINCRPEFDHFYLKSKYPYLAISFFNLIPSCSLCNSGALKGTKPFNFQNHIHPFIESFNDVYEFRTKISSVDFIKNHKEFTITFSEKKELSDQQKALLEKAKKNKKIFALETRYNQHKNVVKDIIYKAYIYNNSTVEDIYAEFKIKKKKIFNSRDEVKRLVFGNLLDHSKHHLSIHSKLITDIADEFGIRI